MRPEVCPFCRQPWSQHDPKQCTRSTELYHQQPRVRPTPGAGALDLNDVLQELDRLIA